MMGLLLKDIYNLSGQMKIYLLYPFFAAFLAYQQGAIDIISFSSAFITMLIIISACAYDEMANFDAYALTLPLTRKDIVLSKYQLALMVSMLNAGVVIIISFLMQTLFPDRFVGTNWQVLLIEIFVVILAINALICLFLPMIFRYGTEKARVLLMVLFIGLGTIVYLLSTVDFSWIQLEQLQFLEDYGLYIVAIVAIIIEWLSIRISNHIMMKKEL